MDFEEKIYIERAESKLLLANVNFNISTNKKLKEELGVPIDKTFFNDVISLAYYGIFYCAKAYLLANGVKTTVPEEHKKTYEGFRNFVDSGKVDRQLLELYEIETQKAEVLLKIFFDEKRKRGIFTYNIKSDANIPVAKESLENSRKFIAMIKLLLK
ncbi:MAG: hypothetical protein ACP5N2_07365 [Candidatus Nanoarchaeia archaeon]